MQSENNKSEMRERHEGRQREEEEEEKRGGWHSE